MFSRRIQLIAWCFYEWGNHAYPILINYYIFAIYFTSYIAPNKIIGTYYWANALTIANIAIAFLSPIFGAFADSYGKHKTWLFLFTYITIITCALLWFCLPNPSYLFVALYLVIIGTITFEIANVFYNTYLFFLAPSHYIGRLSGWSWGLGYIGGIVVLIIALFVFIKNPPHWLNVQEAEQIRICGPLAAIWFLIFSLPLFLFVPNTPNKGIPLWEAVKTGFYSFKSLLQNIHQDKNVFVFLLARMIYTDGLTTLFAFSGIYLSGTLNMNIENIILLGIIGHVTGGLGAILLSWVDDYLGAKIIITSSLLVFIIGFTLILLSSSIVLFWVVVLICSFFIGPIQASSRSLFVRIASKKEITKMFGLFNFSGRVTAFLGPWFLGQATLFFHSQRAGMATVLFFFLIGGAIFYFVKEPTDSIIN